MNDYTKVIGKTYGCYKVLKMLPKDGKTSKVHFLCECQNCGTLRKVEYQHLKNRLYKNCPNCKPKPNLKYDLTGQRFGKLLVLERAENHKQKNGSEKVQYRCLCDCGNECIVQSTHLRSNHTLSCGCVQRERTSKAKLKDITGKRYGKLTAIERIRINGEPYWRCVCDCGGEKIASVRDLNAGHVSSCGCLVSIAEEKMKNILTEGNFDYIQQYKFDECRDIRCLPFDFAILESGKPKMLIELQGEQHYYPFTFNNEDKGTKNKNLEDRIRKDRIKKDFCEKNKIPLLCIRYTMFEKMKDIFNDFYSNILRQGGNLNV